MKNCFDFDNFQLSWRRHFCYFCHLITISSNLTLLSASLALFDDKCTNSRISAVASSSLSWKSRISSSKLLSKIYQKPQNDYWKTFKRWIQSDMLWSYTNKRKRIIAHKRGCFWVCKEFNMDSKCKNTFKDTYS